MSLLTSKRKSFLTAGKEKIELTVDLITSYDEEGYVIAAGGYTLGNGEIEAGYSTTLWATTTSYHRGGKKIKVKDLRISVAINSSPVRLTAEHGIIGGGVFESDEYLNIELNVDPSNVRDIVAELRRDTSHGFRVDGYAISDKVFRVCYFRLSTPRGSVE
jgi:hypothetical protein